MKLFYNKLKVLSVVVILLSFLKTNSISAQGCVNGVYPSSLSFAADNSMELPIYLSTNYYGCTWYQVYSNDSWIYASVDYYAGIVRVYVDSNTGAPRTGYVIIDDYYYITIYQDGCVDLQAPGAINGPDFLCSGSSYTFSITPVNGADGYKWYKDGSLLGYYGSSTNISIGSGSSSTISVRAYNNCEEGPLSYKQVTIFSSLSSGGTLFSSSTNVCYGVDAPVIYCTSLSGGSGSFSYQWYSLPNNTTWEPIPKATSETFDPPGLNFNTRYKRKTIDNYGCGTQYSSELEYIVKSPLTAGEINGVSASCYGAQSEAITSKFLPSNLSTSYTYTWFKSPNGLDSWVSIPNSNSADLIPDNTQTAWYYRMVTDNLCGEVASTDPVEKIVYPALSNPGIINGPNSLCSGSSSSFSINPVEGASGYKWYRDGTLLEYNNSSSIGISFLSGSTSTISVRAYSSCGDGPSSSKQVTIVSAPTSGGIISVSSTKVCYGKDSPTVINCTPPSGGSNSFSYQWQYLPNDNPTAWADAYNGTSESFDIPALYENMTYRRKSTDNLGCGSAVSDNTITITAMPTINGGDISGDNTSCYGNPVGPIYNKYAASSGSEFYTYSWEKSIDTGRNWSYAGGNTVDLIPDALVTTLYRRKVTDNVCGDIVYSSSNVKKIVLNNFTASITGGTSNICNNTSPGIFTAQGNGGIDTYTYLWYLNGTSTEVTTPNFNPGNLVFNATISCAVTSGMCGTITVSKNVIVYDPINVVISGGTTSICQNTSPGILNAIVSGPVGPFTYRWFKNGNETNVTTKDYDIGPLQESATFYCIVSSSCGSDTTSPKTIVVHKPFTASISEVISPIPYNYSPGNLSVIVNGETESYNYLWFRNDTTTGSTSKDFDPGPLQTNSNFYCVVTTQCYTATTPIVSVELLPSTAENILPNRTDPIQAPAIGDQNMNYIKEIVYKEAKTDTLSSSFKHTETINYYDGLGRLAQTILVGATPLGNDLIQPVLYDNIEREKYKLLPYTGPKSGSYRTGDTEIMKSNVNTYYSSNSLVGKDGDNRAYTQIEFDNSPLNRIVSETGPGSDWANNNKSIVINYITNTEPDTGWYVTGNYSYSSFMYPANSLFVTETSDEDGHFVREYKDKLGQIVLKKSKLGNGWLRTAYIYDDFGLLRCVMPPKAKNPNSETGLCYYYFYDSRKRLIEKILPGGGKTKMVYDRRDRIRVTQDANQTVNNEWSYTKYDNLNRPIQTGLVIIEEDTTFIRISINSASMNETRVDSVGKFRNSNDSFPTLKDSVLTETFYDNYDFISGMGLNSNLESDSYDTDGYDFSSITDLTPKGYVTGTMTRVLTDGADTSFISKKVLYSTMYYDKYGHLLRSVSENHINGRDVISNKYEDITYLIRKSRQQHFGYENVTIEKSFDYDHTGRLIETRYKIGDQPEKTLSALVYNEIGELITKYLHSEQTTGYKSFTQKIDYNYNIRGWLSKINDPSNIGNDVFWMALYYNSTSGMEGLSGVANYNGNISGVKWAIKDEPLKGYRFSYDEINRLQGGYYAEGNGLNSKIDYNDEIINGYDKNGNILGLQRKRDNSDLDNLTYKYYPNSNLLESVSPNDSTYEYNSSGNLIRDDSRNLDIEYYSSLSLPKLLDFQNNNRIFYHYSSNGIKLAKHVYVSNNSTDQINYLGNIVCNGQQLIYINTEEGRIIPTGPVGSRTYTYEYDLRDHLGNIRVTFVGKPIGSSIEVRQRVNYYPFGLILSKYDASVTDYPKNKYLYNGKEYQDDSFESSSLNWYDYGARFYDPQIGRWHVIDPSAENYHSWTPYNYTANNPINLIDLDGRDWYEWKNDDGKQAVVWREGNAKSVDINGQSYSNIGSNYTANYDNYSITYDQNEAVEMTETVLNETDWTTQREYTYNDKGTVSGSKNKEGEEGNCFYQAGVMVAASGATSLDGASNNTTGNKVEYLDTQVDQGYSARVHVDRDADGTGDHWVAISSRTTNLRTQTTSSFGFYDPGTINQASGIHNSNILSVSNGILSGPTYYSGKTYTVTAVRKNK